MIQQSRPSKLAASEQRGLFMLRYAAAGSIAAYQTWLSPRKGFCCAYGAATGRWTCSSYAKKIVTEHGTLALAKALPRQFARCRRAHAALLAMAVAAGSITLAAEQAGEEQSDEKKAKGKDSTWGADGACAVLELTSCLPCDGL
jgi:putative component of membrane protein insertase Oxa1/YidC/SpoIIIJ protein YidD